MRRVLILLALSLTMRVSNVRAQEEALDQMTEYFLFSVQTIDDFFDRFNLSPASPFIAYLQSRNPDAAISRKAVIKSLFEEQYRSGNNEKIEKFSTEYGDSIFRVLRFENKDWYATLHCKVVFKGKPRSMDLVMRSESVISKTGRIGYKWSLVSIKANFLGTADTPPARDSLFKPLIRSDDEKFLHPMSHALNFMNIHEVFRKNQTSSYFAFPKQSNTLDSLVKWVNRGQLVFVHVNSVTYHILQLPDWIFQVNYFERESYNSGWLITYLFECPLGEDRKKYKNQILNIN